MNISYYTELSEFTDLSCFQHDINLLSDDIEKICEFVQHNLIHAYWLKRYGVQVEESAKFSEMQTRHSKDIITLAMNKSGQSFDVKRNPKDRVVSVCRDFALVLCSVLRAKNIPARIRCGFATYLVAGHFEDHWICEYWNQQESRWVMVDAQLDSTHLAILNFDFDPCDVPSSEFLYAGKAWALCRGDFTSPDKFGFNSFNGLPFIKGSIIRDLYALSKVELLAWDIGWGILPEYITPIDGDGEVLLLDELALISNISDFEKAINVIISCNEIKFPVDWHLSNCPTIEELYSAL
ncbi:transglutaminase-like domain-containing protein [Photobacterium profundum]|uniref:Transglutaminase-like domain-containing protein n=1 Tax=Photobacterium profundum (strain SS9) TaxID=298386 RepID=Q6LQS6_PHOPR|nr:transglutaminase-like domain-containing protein [Photobacterium profundum]CAG20350.1 hypothetical protein PBPRA1946 [Photobacterium profundum SS9]